MDGGRTISWVFVEGSVAIPSFLPIEDSVSFPVLRSTSGVCLIVLFLDVLRGLLHCSGSTITPFLLDRFSLLTAVSIVEVDEA